MKSNVKNIEIEQVEEKTNVKRLKYITTSHNRTTNSLYKEMQVKRKNICSSDLLKNSASDISSIVRCMAHLK